MYIKWMDTCIKTRVLTCCCCAGSGEVGVMEDAKRDKCVHKVNGQMHKKRVLTACCCAGSGEEGVMEDKKGDKYVHKVDGHMHKNKSTYSLLFCR